MSKLEQAELKNEPSQPEEAAPLFGQTMNAFTWRFVSESTKFVLQMAVMVILAHLINVDQFGLLALAMIVINLVNRISEGGIYYALIQRKEISEMHIRVGFTISLLFGLFFTLVVYLSAPLAASVLKNDAVTPILRLISVTFLFMNFGAVAQGLLLRKLDYQRLLIVELVSNLPGYVLVSIVLALLDYGVWALAWATVAQAVLRAITLVLVSPHSMVPSLAFTETRQLLSFGIGSSLSTLANHAASNGDYFVVGRWLGATALGLYSRSYQLMALPMYQFTSVVSSVLFPVYSIIQDEQRRLMRAYLLSASLSAIVITPIMAGIGISSPEIMTGIFGPAWQGSASPLAILCLGGHFISLFSLGDSLARAKGAVYAKFKCHAIYAFCVVFGSIIGSKWGIIGVACGVVTATIIMYLLMAQLTLKLTGASWKDYLLCQLPAIILAVALLICVYPITLLLRAANFPALVILAGSIIMSAVTVFAVGFMLPRIWLNDITFGAVDRIERMANLAGQYARQYLYKHKLAYKIAHVPFTWYETGVFLSHVSRQGLWASLLESRRAASRQTSQKEMVWDVPFPVCGEPTELIGWLGRQGIKVSEGGHTIYIPPQKGLSDLIPGIVNFYPPSAGFKILKNPGHPARTNYLVPGNEAYLLLHRLVGAPRKQLVVANYAHSLGIGPRMWDLTCWKAQGHYYTVFVVDHVGGEFPSTEQCVTFLKDLKRLDTDSHLRVVIPNWEKGDDFLPPDCHQNLRYSPAQGQPQYVDFQNFCLTSRDAWSKEILSNANGALHWGRKVAFEKDKKSTSVTVDHYADRLWAFISDSFRNASLDLSGRIVQDIGCDSGLIIHRALVEGAAWGIGWNRSDNVALIRDFLLSLGLTRFTLVSADLTRDYRLEDDIPARFRAQLAEAIIFHQSVGRDAGVIDRLRTMPWRALVYEGDQSERVEEVKDLLSPLLAGDATVIAESQIIDDDERPRPVIILLRR